MQKKTKQLCLQALIFLVLFGGTFYFLLKDQDIGKIWQSIANANYGYIFLGLCTIVVFVCSESVIFSYMMKKFGVKTKPIRCVKYSFIGFFVSYITPSATGGQPAQLYYMKKDGLPGSISTLVLLVITVLYKLVLVLVGVWLVFFRKDFIQTYMQDTAFWLYLGLILNVVIIVVILLFIFVPQFVNWFVLGCDRLLVRFHIVKANPQRVERLLQSVAKYHECASFLKTNKFLIWNGLLISVFQRFCQFFVTFLTYKALGLSGYSVIDIVVLQAAISVSVDMLPLPGGVGASEALFISIFSPIFGDLVMSGVLISRGISYYFLLIAGAIFTLLAQIRVMYRGRGHSEKKQRGKG